MTPALRTARATLGLTVLVTAAAVYTMTINAWLGVCGFYTAAFLVWCTQHSYADHRRIVAEHEWARRAAAGECPPPLVPCCSLGLASDGAAHDDRCTDPLARLNIVFKRDGSA